MFDDVIILCMCVYVYRWEAYKWVRLYLINIFQTRSNIPSKRKSRARGDTLSWCLTRSIALISSFFSFSLSRSFCFYSSSYHVDIQHCPIHQTIISCTNDCLTRNSMTSSSLSSYINIEPCLFVYPYITSTTPLLPRYSLQHSHRRGKRMKRRIFLSISWWETK